MVMAQRIHKSTILWIDFGVLGSKEGLAWGIHIKFKLEKEVLVDYSPNKASVLNSIDFRC